MREKVKKTDFSKKKGVISNCTIKTLRITFTTLSFLPRRTKMSLARNIRITKGERDIEKKRIKVKKQVGNIHT